MHLDGDFGKAVDAADADLVIRCAEFVLLLGVEDMAIPAFLSDSATSGAPEKSHGRHNDSQTQDAQQPSTVIDRF